MYDFEPDGMMRIPNPDTSESQATYLADLGGKLSALRFVSLSETSVIQISNSSSSCYHHVTTAPSTQRKGDQALTASLSLQYVVLIVNFQS
jgi:hypothetical protein